MNDKLENGMVVCIRIRGGEFDSDCINYNVKTNSIVHPEHLQSPMQFERVFSHLDSQVQL
jgi:hypothetical protein